MNTANKWALAIVAALVGAFATHYFGRTPPAEIAYTLSVTTFEANKGILPSLSISLGGKEISALSTYTIDFWLANDLYLERAQAAVTFRVPLKVYAMKGSSSSTAHEISCSAEELRCSIGPFNSSAFYRITIVADGLAYSDPRVDLVAKDSKLLKAEDVKRNYGIGGMLSSGFILSILQWMVGVVCGMALIVFRDRKIRPEETPDDAPQ